MVAMNENYFLRYEHGSHRVLVNTVGDYGSGRVRREITVQYPSGERSFKSFREMLKGVVGKATSGVTFDRYFRTERVRDTFVEWGEILVDNKPPISTKENTGIDLSAKHKDIERLMYSGYGKVIHYNGYDPEDVLQEIYRGILARNNGKCPFDESKSSFGHYVHMVIGCILNNYHRKRNKWKENECRAKGYDSDGNFAEQDGSEIAMVEDSYCDDVSYDRAKKELVLVAEDSVSGDMVSYVRPILELLSLGHTQTYIGEHLGLSRAKVNKVVKILRECATEIF
jgi:hypothetical protein